MFWEYCFVKQGVVEILFQLPNTQRIYYIYYIYMQILLNTYTHHKKVRLNFFHKASPKFPFYFSQWPFFFSYLYVLFYFTFVLVFWFLFLVFIVVAVVVVVAAVCFFIEFFSSLYVSKFILFECMKFSDSGNKYNLTFLMNILLVGLVLWHIKSIFMQIALFQTIQFSMNT